ncbi:hypothetical protein CFP71_28450 [Amycolatopsis thailandensis]|uniref:DUF4352 domain-containing protein n=1 Tax=Amycolatopsis thailandensis TaxID=589330 RepID=A0A229RV46_9PSEU|nr:hypothetical protein [Amycolatopsis thailandensis]OXM50361.1 hypothetical protein CFP71_28450 [Amycolatopsis thailandensis]
MTLTLMAALLLPSLVVTASPAYADSVLTVDKVALEKNGFLTFAGSFTCKETALKKQIYAFIWQVDREKKRASHAQGYLFDQSCLREGEAKSFVFSLAPISGSDPFIVGKLERSSLSLKEGPVVLDKVVLRELTAAG